MFTSQELTNFMIAYFTGLGRERSRCEFHLRRRCRVQIPEYARSGSDLPGASGGRGWVRVLRQTLAGDTFLGTQLLWGV